MGTSAGVKKGWLSRPRPTPEEKNERVRAWFRGSKRKAWRSRNRSKRSEIRRWDRLAKNGLTPEAYNKQLKKQRNGCAICTAVKSSNGSRLHVDHDHCTGLFRGLLCATCNLGLGNFKDSITLLQAAIRYLQKSRKGHNR